MTFLVGLEKAGLLTLLILLSTRRRAPRRLRVRISRMVVGDKLQQQRVPRQVRPRFSHCKPTWMLVVGRRVIA